MRSARSFTCGDPARCVAISDIMMSNHADAPHSHHCSDRRLSAPAAIAPSHNRPGRDTASGGRAAKLSSRGFDKRRAADRAERPGQRCPADRSCACCASRLPKACSSRHANPSSRGSTASPEMAWSSSTRPVPRLRSRRRQPSGCSPPAGAPPLRPSCPRLAEPGLPARSRATAFGLLVWASNLGAVVSAAIGVLGAPVRGMFAAQTVILVLAAVTARILRWQERRPAAGTPGSASPALSPLRRGAPDLGLWLLAVAIARLPRSCFRRSRGWRCCSKTRSTGQWCW